MSNFDLRKYLAEGKLLKEIGMEASFLPVDPIPGTTQVYSDIANKIIDKLEGFYNSSEFDSIANKIEQSLDDKTKMALVKATQPKLSGGLENFLKSSVKQNVKSSINEDDMMEDIAYAALNFIRGFAKVNIMGMGLLPSLTAAAIEYFGGYPALSALISLFGSGTAVAVVTVLGTILGAYLVWRLVDIITGEETAIG